MRFRSFGASQWACPAPRIALHEGAVRPTRPSDRQILRNKLSSSSSSPPSSSPSTMSSSFRRMRRGGDSRQRRPGLHTPVHAAAGTSVLDAAASMSTPWAPPPPAPAAPCKTKVSSRDRPAPLFCAHTNPLRSDLPFLGNHGNAKDRSSETRTRARGGRQPSEAVPPLVVVVVDPLPPHPHRWRDDAPRNE
jgi:hypothetical protein